MSVPLNQAGEITRVSVTIDGHELKVAPHTTILTAAEGLGIDIPTFCYQKRLPILASCRMCLVEIEGQGKLQPACATEVRDGMVVRTDTARVEDTRSNMLDMLLANHPLDCPICDKGGECELQDMVMAYGPRESRFRDTKRVFHSKDIRLSPVVIMNVNRCIQCQRCVRMCEEVVGAVALGTVEKGMDTAITGFEGSLASCDQCGNCIEVCPVGALMSYPYRYKARPWDLDETDTVCPHCGTGCQLTVGTRNGEFMRVRSKSEEGLNRELLCVRGRFGMDMFGDPERVKRPMIRKADALVPASWEEAGAFLRERLAALRGRPAAGIAAPRLTNEALYQFRKLMRTVFGTDTVVTSSRWSWPAALGPLVRDFYTRAPFADLIRADCTIVIGSNVTEENPVSEYLLRGAVREGDAALYLLSARPSRLDADARALLRVRPGEEAAVVSALLAGLLDAAGDLTALRSAFPKLDEIRPRLDEGQGTGTLAEIAAALSAAGRATLLVGTDLFRTPAAAAAFAALANLLAVLRALGKDVALQFLFDRPNQLGAWDMTGLAEQAPVADLDHVLDMCAGGEIGALYLAGADPLLSYPDRALALQALKGAGLVIVQDAFLTDTVGVADIVLPAATHGEESGTVTNNEGRVQMVRRFCAPEFEARPNLEIFNAIAGFCEAPLQPARQDEIFEEIARTIPAYKGLAAHALGPDGTFTSTPAQPSQVGALAAPPSDTRAPDGLGLITGNGLFLGGYLSERSETLGTVQDAPYVEMSAADAARRGLADREPVVVQSARGELKAVVKINPRFPGGLVFVPETYRALRLNRLMKRGAYPCPVEVRKAAE